MTLFGFMQRTTASPAAVQRVAAAAAAEPAKKPLLPLRVDLVDVSRTSLATSFAWELEMDFEMLKAEKERLDGRAFACSLEHQSDNRWSLQLGVNEGKITAQVWAAFKEGKTPPFPPWLPLVVSMRLSASSGHSAEWNDLCEAVASRETLISQQDGYALAALDIPADKLKEKDPKRLWSRRYRLQVVFVHDPSVARKSGAREGLPPSFAAASVLSRSASFSCQNDVKLCFPRMLPAKAALWSKAAILSSHSPYFATVLSSDFSEGSTLYQEEAEEEEAAGPHATLSADFGDGEDSDDEADKAFFTSSTAFERSTAGSKPYRCINVHGAWSTYRALLHPSSSSKLVYAPLRSARSADSTTASSYSARLKKQLEDTPHLPLPVSPKSVFRAADFLQLSSLRSSALREYRRQLTPVVAVLELFSPSLLDKGDEVRTLALEYVVKSWADCKDLEELKEVKERFKRGEFPEAGPVLVELMEKVEERRSGRL